MDSARTIIAWGLLGLMTALGSAAAPPRSRFDADGMPLPPGVRLHLGSQRDRTPQPSTALAISPDGKLFAVLHRYGLSVRETATWKERVVYLAPLADRNVSWPRGARAVLAFSADGRSLRVWCPDGRLRTWDVGTGK